MSNLEQKFNLYLDKVKTIQDSNGFIQTDSCDSLGFSALLGCVPGINININSAFDDKTGQWHRKPLSYLECYPNYSASTISRDMLLMLAWHTYINKRLDISEQIIKYALKHWLIMGQADNLKDKIGRCLLVPGLLATYAEISYRLGGPNRWWLRYLPQWEDASAIDYQAHLSVLHILLRKKLTQNISKSHNNILKAQYNRQPGNALFALAAGNKSKCMELLGVEMWWPSDRLPTTEDRKEPWLFQRDYGDDWKPSLEEPVKAHSGGEFLWVYWLSQQEDIAC